jgi:hypothetical protein
MAITTVDGVLAGAQWPRYFAKAVTPTLVAGRPASLYYLAGLPGAGAAPAAGIGGEALTTSTGQIPFTNPGSGNTYLSRFQGMATQAGSLLLCDRLWQNSGITITTTTKQTFTGSVQIPARDANGTNYGHGVQAAVEVSAATGTGTPTLTLEYINQSATTGATATNIFATVATSAIGAFYPIGLAAGDQGIRYPTALTLSGSWASGTIHVVLYRVLAALELANANYPNAIDALTGGFTQMYNNTVPFLVFIPNTTTASYIQGQVQWAQG